MYLFQKDATAAIFTGASQWQNAALIGGEPLSTSMNLFHQYLLDANTVGLNPSRDVLNLFDSTVGSAQQLQQISSFLARRAENGLVSVIVYYVGHGDFLGDGSFAFLLRGGSPSHDQDRLRAFDLARTLQDAAPNVNIIVIFDCCYSGSAFKDFLPSFNRGLAQTTYLAAGIVMYCSASADNRSSSGRGAPRTRFTGALIDALCGLHEERNAQMSLRTVDRRVRSIIQMEVGDGRADLMPQLYEPQAARNSLLDLSICCTSAETNAGDIVERLSQVGINPKYADDLSTLRHAKGIEPIVSRETIALVVSTSPLAELFDRPIAGWLRDEIDRRGGTNPFRRGIIITDEAWFGTNSLHLNPVISIGSPWINRLSKCLEGRPEVDPEADGVYSMRTSEGLMAAFHLNEVARPQAAVWGSYAHTTRRAVEFYSRDLRRGLGRFLAQAWL